MKKRLLLFLLMSFIIGHFQLQAQALQVTGTVTDAKTSEKLPGVSVALQGTSKGAITDIDGKYTIEVPDANAVIVFSYVSYNSETIAVNGRSLIDVTLVPDIKKLDEVVVIGYGTAKKSDISGSSITVSEDQIKGSVVSNLGQALQGRAAGVTATYNSGQPGSSVQISIRGTSTLMAGSSQPLYVVDGVPVQNVSQSGFDLGVGGSLGNGTVSAVSGLSNINPADILTMEILKDASSTAIYGSRGANGVVMITTKKGKTGDAKFTYEGSYGVQKQMNRLKLMNLKQFAQYSIDWAAETNGRDPRIEYLDPSILGEGTNWQDAVFQVAPMQSHQLTASGGTEKVKYFVSAGWFSQEGTVIGTGFNRANARVNLDADLKKWFKIGTNLAVTQSKDKLSLNNSSEGIISVAMLTTPDVPVKNADGSWAGLIYENAPSIINPVAKALDEINKLKRTDFNGNIYSDVTFIKGLTWRMELGGNLNTTDAYNFIPTYKYGSLTNNTNSIARQYSQYYFWQLKNYITYNKQIGKHNITAMVGQEASENSWEYLRGSGTGLSSNDIQEPGLADTKSMVVGSGGGSSALASYFARASYNYADKYYLTYTYRYDGSSNFGPKNRWAPFNSFAGSWRISNETFMESMKSVISNLKLRAGWGQTGNQNIGGYRWGASIGTMPTSLGAGYRQNNIANPYVKWEKQEQTNIGLDLGLLNNRINLVVEVYKKVSSGFLMQMQLPSYMGTRGNASIVLNPPVGNFGKIENKGLEISINTRPIVTSKFTYENDLQITINKNKLLGLQDVPAAYIDGYGQWTDLVSRTEIGQSLFGFYGYKVAGIYQDKQDLLNSPKPAAYPANGDFKRSTTWIGDLKFKDISGPAGAPDGKIDDYDRASLGSPLPKFTFGFNNTFRYENLELNVFINGSYGNKLLNYSSIALSNMNGLWNNQLELVTNHAKLVPIDANKPYPIVNSFGSTINNWFDDVDNVKIANPGGNVPRGVQGDPNGNNRISDRYIEDGSYIRFKNISLAYYVPKKMLKKVGIENLKLYVNVQNMWTITKYTGLDPEIGASQTSDNVMGLDNGRYPSPRIYTFGVNLSF